MSVYSDDLACGVQSQKAMQAYHEEQRILALQEGMKAACEAASAALGALALGVRVSPAGDSYGRRVLDLVVQIPGEKGPRFLPVLLDTGRPMADNRAEHTQGHARLNYAGTRSAWQVLRQGNGYTINPV